VDKHNPAGRSPRPSSRPSRFKRYFLFSFAGMLLLTIAAMTAIGFYIASVIPKTPSIEDLLNARIAEPSVLFSANGTQLAVFSQGYQERVALSQVSPHVVDALVATEDHRFYEHQGIDLQRIVSAVFHTLGGDAQGGSTITQQLVRNMFPEEIGRSRTIERKLKEIITALKIERTYTKDEILETYLNTVPFLYSVLGIEMAARTYYDKSAAELDVLESATLIGMLKGTSYYNPILNPERAQKRRNVVLAQMVKRGVLEQEEFETLRDEPLQVQLHRQPDPLGSAPHFAAHVRKWLIEWADKNDYNIYADGLIVHSTLDDQLQQAATEAVDRQAEVLQQIADVEWGRSSPRVASHSAKAYAALRKKVEPFSHFWTERPDLLDAFIRESAEYRKAVAGGQAEKAVLAKLKDNKDFMDRLRVVKTRLEAGFVAMDPGSGEVKAWVGSRDFTTDQFDHVAQAARQPGSTFKPFVYGAALEAGMVPERMYFDGKVEIRSVDGTVWRPTDMSGPSGRMMTIREGLILSKNTITAQLMQDVGLDNIAALARASGVNRSPLHKVPSLALGTSPVTLLEMVSAYSTIAQVGQHHEPLFIRRITDRSGRVLAEFVPEGKPAMSEETAIELIDMMRGVVRQGTGQAVKTNFGVVGDLAGKTGTTQNNTDGWFILMHPNLVAGAWVGFNDSRVTMRSDHWGQGGHNAILLVGDFFRGMMKSKLINAKAKFPSPNRPPPLMVQTPSDEWLNQITQGEQVPSGYGVINRNGETVVIGPDGVVQGSVQPERQAGALPPLITVDESGRMTGNLNREPVTDASGAISSGGSSGSGTGNGNAGGPDNNGTSSGRMPSQADINVW
jgi:penicillin-binding protein 1A